MTQLQLSTKTNLPKSYNEVLFGNTELLKKTIENVLKPFLFYQTKLWPTNTSN